MHYSNKKFSLKIIYSLAFVLFFTTVKLIAQPLVVDGGLHQTICLGSSTGVGGSPTANYGAGGYTYVWAPAAGLSSTNVSNPTASPTATTTYTIQVTDAALAVATATVTITVNPSPTVDAIFSPLVCNGATVSGTSFTSTPGGATFNWTNSNTSIGIPASGTGDIPSFTATNSTSTLIGGNISVTATLAGCTGPPTNYTISVKPTPGVISLPLTQTRCSGVNSNFVLSGTVSGTTFSWTTTGSGVSGNTPSSGSVISQSVTATTSTSGTANYYVTPVAAGCAGSMITTTLTVDPIPVATATTSPLTRCSGDTVSFAVTSDVAGTTFTWTTFATNVTGADASGTGTYVFDTLTATTAAAGTMVYVFTPVAAGCSGSQAFPFVTVNPPVDSDFSYSSSGCQFSTNALPSFLPGAGAGTFTSSPAGMVINATTGEIDLTSSLPGSYIVTNTIAAAGGCPSTNHNHGFTITPFPDVIASPVAYPAMCSGDLASVSFSSSVGGTTFPWTSSEMGSSGSALSGTGNISEVLSASFSSGSTTYTITPTNGACIGTPLTYVVNVTALPSSNFMLPAGPYCQFGPNIFLGFPGAAAPGIFSASPAGLVFNSSTGEIDMTASTPGTYDYTNTIVAASGCPAVADTLFGFVVTPFLDPTITDVTSVCYSDAPFNFVAATTGGNWSGVGITNSSLGTFDPAPAGLGTFTITYSSPGPCTNIDTTVITVTSADIHGKVTYSGGDLISGTNSAVLYNYYSAFATFDTAQTCTIDALGYYHFASAYPGDYLIKIFADTLVYPLAVPTYYDSEYLWDTALVKTHGCLTDTADVYLIEGIVGVGPGMISGNVLEASGFVRTPGDPIPGLDVKLGKNPGGAMISSTQTNIAGNFDFTNLGINAPGEYYTVYVDIPGLGRDSVYNIHITATDTIFTMMDHLADSNSVWPIYPVNVSVASHGSEEVKFIVYPNPTNTSSTIVYTLTTNNRVQLDVYNVLGKKVESLVNANQSAGDYKVNLAKLEAGIYFITLNINNNSNTTRLVVID